MDIWKRHMAGVLLCGCFIMPLTAADELAVQDDDVVVILGDELSGSGDPRHANIYPVYVDSFLLSRYPQLHVRFINRSRAGDTVRLATLRLERDILKHKPTVIVICLGMNDPQYLPFSEAKLQTFKDGLVQLIDKCKDSGARVWLISPPRVEEPLAGKARVIRRGSRVVVDLGRIGYDATLGQYAEAVREVAKTTESGFVDWYAAMSAIKAETQTAGSDMVMTATNGWTPSARSQALVAMRLLKAWGAEPIRAKIDLDWRAGTATVTSHLAEETTVPMEIHEDGRHVLELKDVPIPWFAFAGSGALDPAWEAAEMCRITLKMAHPPAKGIVLQPGGKKDASERFSADELQAGVNLATTRLLKTVTGISDLYYLLGQKNGYWYFPWRQMALRPPAETELVRPQQMLLEAYAAYAEAYEEILAKRPKTFEATITLSEVTQAERLPTREIPEDKVP